MNKKLITLSILPVILLALIIAILLHLGILSFSPNSVITGKNSEPWDGKTLVLGTEGAYPPFNDVVRDKPVGFDIDIGNAICDVMQVECKWVIEEWDKMIPSLLDNKYDVILASMSITEERQKTINFTNKYYVNPLQFAEIRGRNHKVSPEELKGKTIGVQKGTVQETVLKSKFAQAKIKSYDTQEETNQALLDRKIDVMLMEALTLDGYLKTKEGFKVAAAGKTIINKQDIGEGVGIGIRKQDDELRSKINSAIQEIRSNGTYRKINNEYFPFDIYGEK